MNGSRKILICAVALMVSGQCAFGAEYFVSMEGTDSNAGTETRPFRTVQKAADAMGPGDTCYVREGTYRESVKVVTSGANGRSVRFAAYPGEVVTLSGTERIDVEWTVHEGHIYKTTVPRNFDQLFVDGAMMIEARWPNAAFDELLDRSKWARAAKGSRYGRMRDPELTKTGVDWTGALATLNVTHQFWTWTRFVTDHKPGRPYFEYPKNLGSSTEMRYGEKTVPWEDDRYYLSGVLGALDAPGEWFLDRKTRTLYLWTKDGADPASRRVEYKVRDYAFTGEDIKHVELDGFHFFGATFRFRSANHCTIDNCHLLYPTYTRELVEMNPKEGRSPVTGISGNDNTVRNSSLAYTPVQGLTMSGSRNLIENCLIHDVCWSGSLKYTAIHVGAGEGARDEDGSVARGNTVFNCGNAIISYRSRPHVIEKNHVYDGGLACRDIALIYTGQPSCAGSVVRYNWVHGCRTEDGKGLGIRGDDQTRSLTLHHNVIWDCGRDGIIVKGDFNKVYNNTIMNIGTDTDPGNYIVLPVRTEPAKPWRIQHPLLKQQNKHSEIFNNATLNINGDQSKKTPFPWKQNFANNVTKRSLELANPGQWDFTPDGGSPLVDAGRDIPGFTDGFAGRAPDVGAYERGEKQWVPGCTNSLWVSAPEIDNGRQTVRMALRMPPLSPVRLDITGNGVNSILNFSSDDWMRSKTVPLPEGTTHLNCMDIRLGRTSVFFAKGIDQSSAKAVSFNRPMLPLGTPKLGGETTRPGGHMITTLKNDTLEMSVNSLGAELVSVKTVADGTEFMWQADPKFWDRHAPVLFPVVGKVVNDRYRFGGKEYEMGQHGFARDHEFELVEKTDDTLTYELRESAGTLVNYPFRFVLRITYALEGNMVKIGYTVTNPAETDLFFSIGGHPGFRCPIEDTESFSDYLLEFNTNETVGRRIAKDGLFCDIEPKFLENGRTIDVTTDLFKTGALVFDILRSTSVKLRSKKSNRAVTFDFTGFPYLGIWTRYGSDKFVCIEPWYGLADSKTFDGDFTEKEGIQKLAPGKTFNCIYTMVFE